MLALLELFKFKLAANACGTTTGPLPSIWDNIPCTGGNPDIGSVQDVFVVVGNVVRILIALSGGIAMIVIMAAAIYYVASTGDPARIQKAKAILTNMTIGLVLIIASYAILTYIAKNF
jgi:hypothetical protein